MQMLQVQGKRIVDAQGKTVRLRGTCVGGWMNMENFINGYPGAEHGVRAAVAEVLGPSKGRFFFDRMLDYFFAEDDIAFLKACGSTVVRLPINYRHFEDDSRPFTFIEEGFRRLDQAVQWCAKHELYVIIDLHAVQGWQNQGWHSDNGKSHALFWRHPHFQDRFVALWEELARRYRGNPTIAGYNIMNEPICNASENRPAGTYVPDWPLMNAVYRRTVNAIRAIDPQHIVFLEGDNYSRLFSGLDAPFADNLVYSSHNYCLAGFGPGPYPGVCRGEYWDKAKHRQVFAATEGVQFMEKYNVPLWVGEFGSVYNGAPEERGDRLRSMDDQIDVLEEFGVHWTTWTYKDVGVMGWVELDPRSEYMQIIRPSLDQKLKLDTDAWISWLPPSPAKQKIVELARYVEQTVGDPDVQPALNERNLADAALACYVGTLLQPTYARLFRGMSEADIDRVMQSFAFRNCRPNRELSQILSRHMARPQ